MDYPKSVPSVGLVNGKFVDEDTATGTQGSLIPAAWGNSVTQEILGVIIAAGFQPQEEDNTQLGQAISRIVNDAAADIASETVAGIAKVATQSQTNSGLDDASFVTPRKFSAALAALIVQATESIRGIAKVATQSQTNSGVDDETFVTPRKFSAGLASLIVQATEGIRGIAKIATQPQTNAGTDDATIVTPQKMRYGFSVSFASANGFIVFPTWLGSFIIQWGSRSVPANSSSNYSFPLTFPIASMGCLASFAIPAQSTLNVVSISTSQFQLQNLYTGGSQTATFLAWGY